MRRLCCCHFFFRRHVRTEAERLFGILFPNGYAGEVFLCGGAFKPLLKDKLPIADFDLWVRNGGEREKLVAALLGRNALIVRDFRPFVIKFRLENQVVEVNHGDIGAATLDQLLGTFDLALSGIGSRYANGRVREVVVTKEFWRAARDRSVNVQASHFAHLLVQRQPRLLCTVHRMRRQAAELNYQMNTNHEIKLWEIYWNEYTEADRSVAIDFYLNTIVEYKGQHDEYIVR